ncbi:MAG TPA: hypothetical protein VM513_06195 [Kofleriaceae bacterium]|nr:hypothetical protein [Kofleriaceae bacterium]
MRLARLAFGIALVAAVTASADPRPTLDEFYERTREREDGFEACIGYCDGTYLASFLVGAQTANPSTVAAAPRVASGLRLGVDLGVRGSRPEVVRGKLWADVLRVNADGTWITDLAGQLTAFKVFGRPNDDQGLHLSLDTVASRRTELRPGDIARLTRVPYQTVDSELEVTPLGPKVDKSSHIALPLGVAYRLRAPTSGGPLEHRTVVSGALAFRGYDKGIRTHAQLDALRVKYTHWDVPGGEVSATTVSAGYQRLPYGLDTLPLWALVGYQWTEQRNSVIAQIGMDLPLATSIGELEIAPAYEHHLELDPMTAMFHEVTALRMALRHRYAFVQWGVTYEAALVEEQHRLHAITPELGVSYGGFELGVQYRFTIAHDEPAVMMPTALRDRFNIALDRRF